MRCWDTNVFYYIYYLPWEHNLIWSASTLILIIQNKIRLSHSGDRWKWQLPALSCGEFQSEAETRHHLDQLPLRPVSWCHGLYDILDNTSVTVRSWYPVLHYRVGTRYFFLGSILMRPHFGTDTSEVCLHILLEDFFLKFWQI